MLSMLFLGTFNVIIASPQDVTVAARWFLVASDPIRVNTRTKTIARARAVRQLGNINRETDLGSVVQPWVLAMGISMP